ncbi:hypothetical protein IFM89_023952 [Coptis chinensis]|uniref:Uncharacterized protein n=1 Tax=Coptis chinensis TaxID=261450 RepID=A0A835HRN0_9MAGN|nr:hypothetical protein IFM89_023952 [Coptis chinensis]
MGCIGSKPLQSDCPPATLPAGENLTREAPTVTNVEGEAAAQENKNEGGEGQQKVEEPLVDLSEPSPITKTDGDVPNESNNPVADLISIVDATKNSEGGQTETTKQNEDSVVAGNETKEDAPTKEDHETQKTADETKVVKAGSLEEKDKPSVTYT